MGSKPLPWPTYPVVDPLTELPCGCSSTRWSRVDGKLRVVDGLGREILGVVDFDVVTAVAKSYGPASFLSYDTTHGARLFCAHGEVRAVDEEPKAAPAVVKADAWPLLHGVFERLQAAENSARKGDTTSALLRVISAVRDLACVEQVPVGGK